MIFTAEFKALKTLKKDWEINGKTGVSRKTQILIESFGEYSALSVRTAKDVPDLEPGENYTGLFEVSESFKDKNLFDLELVKID